MRELLESVSSSIDHVMFGTGMPKPKHVSRIVWLSVALVSGGMITTEGLTAVGEGKKVRKDDNIQNW